MNISSTTPGLWVYKELITKEQLEKGVNLAAEFEETPFATAFAKLDALVAIKQLYETVLIKNHHVALRTLQSATVNDDVRFEPHARRDR